MLREDNLFFKRSILVFKKIANEILKKKKSGKPGAVSNNKINFEQNVNLAARKTAVFIIN